MPGVLGPLFARHDPSTSRKAAERISKSLGWHQRAALALVEGNPGRTCKELAERCLRTALATDFGPFSEGGLEGVRQRIGRRLNELEKALLIRREGERDGCSVWWPGDRP